MRSEGAPVSAGACPLVAQASTFLLTSVTKGLCRASAAGCKSSSSMTKLTFTRDAPWEIILILMSSTAVKILPTCQARRLLSPTRQVIT